MPQDIVEFYGTEEVMRRVVAAGGEIYDAHWSPTPRSGMTIAGIPDVRFSAVRRVTWEELLAWHQEHFPEWAATQNWEQKFPYTYVFRGD